jgi:plastocyanin domain-containing protein
MSKPSQLRTLGVAALLSLACSCERKPAPGEGNTQPAAGAAAELRLTVDGSGYHPAAVNAPAGKPVRLSITRTSDEGCGQQIVFPSLDIRRDLPLNQVVTVDLIMPDKGSIAFTCGMDMMRGSIVAQ